MKIINTSNNSKIKTQIIRNFHIWRDNIKKLYINNILLTFIYNPSK
jgi:hypothetical protein